MRSYQILWIRANINVCGNSRILVVVDDIAKKSSQDSVPLSHINSIELLCA